MAIQLMLAAFENFVILDAEYDVQIAVRAAFASGIAFAGNAHLVPVIDAGGNLQFDGSLTNHSTFAPAGFAGILDDFSGPAALRTRARNAEETLLKTHLSMAIARRAGRRAAALLSATAGTLHTRLMTRILDLSRHAEGGIFKFKLQIVTKIRSALDSTPSMTAAKRISETENIAEHIAEVGKDARIETGIAACGAAQSGMAIPVICRAFLGIGKNRIGLGRFLESILGLFVSGIAIRVVLKRKLSICALHFLVRRRFSDAQNFVIVSL
jgi:hypothetical protein